MRRRDGIELSGRCAGGRNCARSLQHTRRARTPPPWHWGVWTEMGRRQPYFAGGSRFLKGSAASSWPLRLLKNISAINPHPIRREKKVPRPSAIQPCLLISMPLVRFQTEMAQITAAAHIKRRTARRISWPTLMRFIIWSLSFSLRARAARTPARRRRRARAQILQSFRRGCWARHTTKTSTRCSAWPILASRSWAYSLAEMRIPLAPIRTRSRPSTA